MRNPPETITPHEKLTEAESEAYNLLVPKHKESAIKPEELIKPRGPYEADAVAKDNAEVERLNEIFKNEERNDPRKREEKQRAELFEALLAERIELDNWFGQEAETIIPSRYDDIKRGVDLLVEFEIESGFVKYLGLSIDATTYIPKIVEKIDKIRNDIRHGHLTTLKYFHSEKTGNAGMLKDVPKVIIGADFRQIREIAGLWLNLEKLKVKKMELMNQDRNHPELVSVREQIKSFAERLTNHRIQFQILWEIKAQLLYFRQLAVAQGKDAITAKYQNALETIGRVLDAKEPVLSDEDGRNIKRDTAYRTIMREVS